MVHAGFPDLHFDIEDMLAEEDKVVYRYTVRGTNQMILWVLLRLEISFTGIHICRVSDGKLEEEWKTGTRWD
jgi:predicted ester cyclase